MRPVVTVLRICFVVLFGAMSLLHGPVMTFSTAHAVGTGHQHAEAAEAALPDCHEEAAPAPGHTACNAFACFMAVEPLPVMVRPITPLLFATMAATPATALDPVSTAPTLPPPRLLS
jgi:hypothetical protein